MRDELLDGVRADDGDSPIVGVDVSVREGDTLDDGDREGLADGVISRVGVGLSDAVAAGGCVIDVSDAEIDGDCVCVESSKLTNHATPCANSVAITPQTEKLQYC